MMTSPRKLSISQLSLYNPSRLSDEEIVASFAARQAVFDRILADIASEKPKSRAQHHLIVGQRGMGKSTLLARIAAELRTKPELSAVYIPLVFAEEQYAVDRLSKFWLNCLDSLADACEKIGDTVAPKRIDDLVRKLESRPGSTAAIDEGQSEILEAFLAEARTLQRRPVLLVDNLQLVFERITEQQQHVLRELLMRPGGPVLIGASPSPPPESQDYGAAFYDHFKTHYLPPLSVAEMRQLMLTLAEKFGNTTIRDRITRHPHRLSVLRQMTGGNPRTTVTLFFLYAEDFAATVFGDLENLLDRVTPLYKARFEELSAQQQVVASAIANHWNPVTARQLADATSLPITGISPQLDRLERIGFIERVTLFEESSTGYQIAERFFNVWFLMRSSSRRKKGEVKFLAGFVESFYEPEDRSRLAQLMLTERDFSPDRQMFARSLASTLDNGDGRDLQRHADLDALRQTGLEARRKLEEVIDFSKLEPSLLKFSDLRAKLVELVPEDAIVEKEKFADLILGDLAMFQTGERLRLASKTAMSKIEMSAIEVSLHFQRAANEERYDGLSMEWLSHRLSTGLLADFNHAEDWESAIRQAPSSLAIHALADTVPLAVGEQLSEESIRRIRECILSTDAEEGQRLANWGFFLQVKLGRLSEAEVTYRNAIRIDGRLAQAWNNLAHILEGTHRYEEARTAYEQAIALAPTHHYPWNGLGNLLARHFCQYEQAEAAYLESATVNSLYATPWKNLGNIYCDHLNRFHDSDIAFNKALSISPGYAEALSGLIFLHRDFLAEGSESLHQFEALNILSQSELKDTAELHIALFAAYAENWGDARNAIERALSHVTKGTDDDWQRASAVLLHLNYGEQLLAFLRERGDDARLRPWYEALVALHKGDRRFLRNLAPEVRTTAEVYFDQIEKRLNALPEKTRRRPLPKPAKTKPTRGRKRS
jgi:tetratricopeptide (TPR) repeat protein